ncbi:MAG: hypothetical protein HOB38_05880 [Deltaproteobacteria bacterium]|nr:hypothetical protein [Deltaproteobacteria bacterium]
MINKYSFFWLIPLFLFLEPAVALTKYGTAQIQAGHLIVVRDGQESVYASEDGEVEVRLNDVIRVGQNSFVILKTEEQTDIKMGSNAVFQVKPWKNRKKSGYLRMLYGKMNFKTKKLQKRKRFRFKTASATIGVKGTGADCEVGSTGNTGCTGRSGKTEIQGNSGPPRDLTTNQMSIVVGNGPASQTIEVPQEESAAEGEGEDPEKAEVKTFAKASPTSSQSSSLSQEGIAVEAGIIEQEHLEESKKEEVTVDESLEQEQEAEAQEDADEEDADTDEEFEEDLKESEESMEVAELEVNVPVDIAGQIEVDTATETTPEIPEVNVDDDIEDAVQESKNSMGKLNLDFEN